MDHPTSGLKEIIASSFTARLARTAALSGTIFLSLFLSILPPLVLQRAIDALTEGKATTARRTAAPRKPQRPCPDHGVMTL